MATEIDNLQININAQSEQAGVAIDRLVAQIDRLTASLGRVGATNFNTTSTNMVVGLNRTSSSASKAKKSFGGLASAIGKFYATYFMAVRGIKAFGRAIEGTADYLEAFNYFDVALNKIGKDWAFQWEKYGYSNAEEYASSFSKRLTEKLSGMSGLKLDISADGKTGLLTDSAMKNLGLNIQEVTQYASQLASVTNSIGQTGEVSLAAASAFTKLGADMSSLFNMKYSDAMKNLQSGLIGQSRALYKYGIDITNATLQTYAYKLGVEKAVSEMTQAEKMQLRMVAILDQSKVSWGDLANTINSPSNMLRQFTNNVKEAGMVLGQIFIPLLEKIMPVINGVTIAIKRLLVNFATMMGIKIDLSSFGQSTSGVADEIDGISDSLDDVSKSAKKAKAGIRAFDELNIIKTPSESSSGSSGGGSSIDLTEDILKATEAYENAWNEAFASMENKAQAYADKVYNIFASGDWYGVGNMAGDQINSAINAFPWEGTGKTITNAICNALDFASGFINSVDWKQLGNDIIKMVNNINLGEIVVKAFDLTLDLAGAVIDLVFGAYEEIYNKYGIGGVIATILVPGGIVTVKLATEIWANIDESKYVQRAEEATKNIREAIEGKWGTFSDWFDQNVITPVHDFFQGLWESVSGFFVNLWKDISSVWSTVADWFNTYVVDPVVNFFVGFATRVKQIFEGLWIIIQAVWIIVSSWFDEHVITPIANGFNKLWNGIKSVWNTVANWFNTYVITPLVDFFKIVWTKVSGFFSDLWSGIKNVWKGASGWFNKTIIIPVSNAFETACDKIGGFFTSLWKGIKKGVVGAMNSVIASIESGINFFVDGINKILKGFNKVVSWANTVAGKNWGGVDLVKKVSLTRININQYEFGGFPKEGSLFWANEAGPELVGTMNGRTAVAPHGEITGIRDEIRATSNEEMILLRQQNVLLQAILEKELGITKDDIGKAARDWGYGEYRRSGNQVFSY